MTFCCVLKKKYFYYYTNFKKYDHYFHLTYPKISLEEYNIPELGDVKIVVTGDSDVKAFGFDVIVVGDKVLLDLPAKS